LTIDCREQWRLCNNIHWPLGLCKLGNSNTEALKTPEPVRGLTEIRTVSSHFTDGKGMKKTRDFANEKTTPRYISSQSHKWRTASNVCNCRPSSLRRLRESAHCVSIYPPGSSRTDHAHRQRNSSRPRLSPLIAFYRTRVL